MLALARLLFDTMNHCERGTGSEYWGQHGCIQRPRKGRRGEKRTADWSQPGQEPLLHQGTNPTMANVCREKRFASHRPSAPSVARTAFVLVNGDWEDSSSQDEATGLSEGDWGGVRIWSPGKGRVDRLHAALARRHTFFSVRALSSHCSVISNVVPATRRGERTEWGKEGRKKKRAHANYLSPG